MNLLSKIYLDGTHSKLLVASGTSDLSHIGKFTCLAWLSWTSELTQANLATWQANLANLAKLAKLDFQGRNFQFILYVLGHYFLILGQKPLWTKNIIVVFFPRKITC